VVAEWCGQEVPRFLLVFEAREVMLRKDTDKSNHHRMTYAVGTQEMRWANCIEVQFVEDQHH
jgi:hypothetical protein